MRVLKFGGNSVANADNIKSISAFWGNLLRKIMNRNGLSAFGGATDDLLEAASLASRGRCFS